MAGLVTTNNVAHWKQWNFGRKLLQQNQITLDLIRQEIQKYSAKDATQVRSYMHDHCSLEATTNAFLELAAIVMAESRSAENITPDDEQREFSQFECDNLHPLDIAQSIAQLSVQVGILHHQLKQSAKKMGYIQMQLDSVYASYSWRFTEPIRFLIQKIMRLCRKFLPEP